MVVETPWSTLGYLVAKRTYTRLLDPTLGPDSPTEEWEDVIERVIEACDSQLNVGFDTDEEDRVREYMLGLKFSVAGRFLWQLGTETVDRIGLASLQNCAFTTIDHPIRPFTWAMDMLCLGSGVGYNIQKHNVDKLPEVRTWFKAPTRWDDGGADFIVPDSREGWVRLLGKTLKAAFLSHAPEKGTFSYSTQVVRGAGSPIRGFGGVAQGPQALVEGIADISKILERRKGKKIRPIDALDIMNLIGRVVVSGNVRRSAQIAIGDCHDVDFLKAKRWDLGTIPPWRAMSNNSVIADKIEDLPEEFWEGYKGNGEAYGIINLKLSRQVGRLGDYQYPDPLINGVNPFH